MARATLVAFLAAFLFACESSDSTDVDGGARHDAPPLVDAGPPADLDGYIEHFMSAGGIPGLAAALLHDGEIAWIGTYGYADVESLRPVDEHTLFVAASISKTITATRAMQLVEAGMLDLDVPVETYVDFDVRHPEHPTIPITTRMLLTHMAGIEDVWTKLAAVNVNGGDPTVSLAEFAEGYLTPGGAYYTAGNWGAQPLTRRSYTNAAFGLVGAVLEAVGGASFREQTRAAIFEPVGMDGAGWFLEDIERDRLATPYVWARRFAAQPHLGFAFYPAGSLRVSIIGLARFLLAIAEGGAIDGARILSEESVTEMLRIQRPEISGGQALSWSERSLGGHLYIGHGGETLGGSTEMLLSREGTHGIVLLTNSDAYLRETLGMPDGERAMQAILERLHEEALSL